MGAKYYFGGSKVSNFFALVFLVSCVGTWFFIKKQTNRKKLNVGIGLILISIVCIGLLGGCTAKSNGKDAASSSSSTTISTSEVKKEKLTLKAPAEVEAGTNKKAEITGVTLPGAVVSIDSGNSVTADNQNHQCELVVCSSAKSLYYRLGLKGPLNGSPYAPLLLTDSKRISFYFFGFLSPVNGSNSSNNVN